MSAARGSSILAAAASCCDFVVKYRSVAMPMHMDAFSASGQALVEKSSLKDDASASSHTSVAMPSDKDSLSASGQTLVDKSFYGDNASASCPSCPTDTPDPCDI